MFLIGKCLEIIDYDAKNQSEGLLNEEKIADLTVTITPQHALNTIRGVISKRAPLDEADLLEGTLYEEMGKSNYDICKHHLARHCEGLYLLAVQSSASTEPEASNVVALQLAVLQNVARRRSTLETSKHKLFLLPQPTWVPVLCLDRAGV